MGRSASPRVRQNDAAFHNSLDASSTRAALFTAAESITGTRGKLLPRKIVRSPDLYHYTVLLRGSRGTVGRRCTAVGPTIQARRGATFKTATTVIVSRFYLCASATASLQRPGSHRNLPEEVVMLCRRST
jgi:hypothetical protein